MGQCHIVTIYEDGISNFGEPKHEVSEDLGRTVIDLCMAPLHEWTDSGPKRVKDGKIGHCSNCVNWVDDICSTEERVYVFAGNCLRPLSALSPEERASVRKLMDQES